MWLVTTRGFYSVVEKPGDADDGMLTVRTRNRTDIDALKDFFPEAKPYRIKVSDYNWRIRVPREEWMEAVAKMVAEIDYSNFKDAVKATQGKTRAGVYMRVWGALLALSDRTPPARSRSRSRRARDSWDDFGGDYDTGTLFGGRS